MLGCSAPVLATLRSAISARVVKENYYDCALVISDEHLSRESRKLTVMIQQEIGQPLDDSPESLGFLRINEGPFPGHLHTRPYSDAREGTRGYIVAPLLDSHG